MSESNRLSISAVDGRGRSLHPVSSTSVSTDTLFANAYSLQQAGRFKDAAGMYVKALRQRKDDPAIYNNLGNCLRSIGGYEASIQCFDKALRLHPDRPSSLLNRSLALLSLGEYERAWPGYESRLEVIDYRKELLQHRERKWKGERLRKSQPLYLYGNQGLGDEIQCLRFLPEIAKRAGRIIVELQRPLLGFARDLPANFEVIERGQPVPAFARWCEFFSLPGILRIEEKAIPAPIPPSYSADLQVADWIEENRGRNPGKLQVGIVWSGNPANPQNAQRSCPLSQWTPLLSHTDVSFVSLQVGQPQGDLDKIESRFRPADLSPLLCDFDATATAVDALDLVISTDTSVPHLVGTLGRNGWVLLPRFSDWRWGREPNATPWYPSLTLFRQTRAGDWSAVMKRLARVLEKKIRPRAAVTVSHTSQEHP